MRTKNWHDIYDIEDVDLAYNFFESRVVNILDEMCPFRTIQYRSEHKPWLSDDTKDMMSIRDDTRELARRTKDEAVWKTYRSQRNLVNRLVDQDRRKYYDDIYSRHANNNDVGAIYRTAKDQIGWSKNTSPTSFVINGSKITKPQEMANAQSKAFTDKTSKLLREIPLSATDPCETLTKSLDKWGSQKMKREKFEFKKITNIDTLKVLKDLGNTTSSANDSIDSLSLKHGAQYLHGPITHIVNCSITSSRFATKWKIGKLLPLYKGKGLDPHCPSSYRPISLLPIMGKIAERLLQSQILKFMEDSGQLNTNIHSYRKNHSTVTSMLQLSEVMFRGCENKKITTLITLDQSAAFDVIRHTTLLRKLSLYNFGKQRRKMD